MSRKHRQEELLQLSETSEKMCTVHDSVPCRKLFAPWSKVSLYLPAGKNDENVFVMRFDGKNRRCLEPSRIRAQLFNFLSESLRRLSDDSKCA